MMRIGIGVALVPACWLLLAAGSPGASGLSSAGMGGQEGRPAVALGSSVGRTDAEYTIYLRLGDEGLFFPDSARGADWSLAEDMPRDSAGLLRFVQGEKDAERRAVAVRVLGLRRYREVVPALIDIVDAPTPAVGAANWLETSRLQLAAISALGHIGDRRGVPALVRAEGKDGAGPPGGVLVYRYAVGWDPIEYAMSLPSGRYPAASGMVAPLPYVAGDAGFELYAAAAARALGELGSRDAVPHLLERLQDPKYEHAPVVLEALAKLGGAEAEAGARRFIERQEPGSWIAERAGQMLAGIQSHQEDVGALQVDLFAEEPAVVYFAIQRLVEKREAGAVPLLETLIDDHRTFLAWGPYGVSVEYGLDYVAKEAIFTLQTVAAGADY